MGDQIYFSVKPKYSGLTDQLLQFDALYHLGLSLGYVYWHEPFTSPRSSSPDLLSPLRWRLTRILNRWPFLTKLFHKIGMPFNVYKFLGIDDYFLAGNEDFDLGKAAALGVTFDDQLAQDHDIDSMAKLQDYVRATVAKQASGRKTILVRFSLAGKWPVWQLIREHMAGRRSRLDLRSIYFQKRREQPWPSLFETGKMKCMVHMRLGDTALLPTPWDTFIFLWPPRYEFQEYPKKEDMPASYRVFSPQEYFDFYDSLLARLSEPPSTLFFSDGYRRAVRKLDRGMKRLQFSKQQEQRLRAAVKGFDESAFDIFAEIEGSRLVIGEDPHNLCHLIHSFLTADIVVIGSQQWMMPKMAALYCDKENMPLIIVLNKADQEDIWQYGGLYLEDKKENFLFVNANKPDWHQIVACMETHFARKQQAGSEGAAKGKEKDG